MASKSWSVDGLTATGLGFTGLLCGNFATQTVSATSMAADRTKRACGANHPNQLWLGSAATCCRIRASKPKEGSTAGTSSITFQSPRTSSARVLQAAQPARCCSTSRRSRGFACWSRYPIKPFEISSHDFMMAFLPLRVAPQAGLPEGPVARAESRRRETAAILARLPSNPKLPQFLRNPSLHTYAAKPPRVAFQEVTKSPGG